MIFLPGSVLALTVLGQLFLGCIVPLSTWILLFQKHLEGDLPGMFMSNCACLFAAVTVFLSVHAAGLGCLLELRSLSLLLNPFSVSFYVLFSMSLCFIPYHAFRSISSPFCSFLFYPHFGLFFPSASSLSRASHASLLPVISLPLP